MKTAMFNQSLPNVQELSVESCGMIRGGESPWYWIGYMLGSFVDGITGDVSNSGQRVYYAALG
ncbi:MAG: hypothetical protein Q8918_17270 [Bacteroidota bacterium]|nr:hypothetical protein [Bacteroidota bacterium]MDP4211648.1 hypothetical protein [Bacteroidota bacterium]MDP4251854.1 hypothetical protein [Bacteroidota bacterium]